MQYVHFVKNGFNIQTDFTVAWYAATNYGLPSNKRLHFQGKIIKVNHI
jgi:hypothetical protein